MTKYIFFPTTQHRAFDNTHNPQLIGVTQLGNDETKVKIHLCHAC